MNESLAVRYRPHTFDAVTSQSSIIKILQRQLSLRKFSNVYLFCGPSGCGKTTIARIFANEINNYSGVPIEIDGASNNGVDNVKQLIKDASERALDGEYKIYIVDECHMLTTQAWNAFLKCIEEPPTYTIFMFCTTDPQKIPATILNRVMRFNLTRISADKICDRLKYISKEEGYTNYEETCDYISRICGGGMRDAVALLEKCAGYDTNLSIDNALNALGDYSYQTFFKLINDVIDGKTDSVLTIISDLYNQGNDLKLFIDKFLDFCLDLSKYSLTGSMSITKIPSTMEEQCKNACNFEKSSDYYFYIINKLLNLKTISKNDTNIKSTIEVEFINMSRCV